MYASPSRSIDKALGKFKLIPGQGDGKKTACAMTMLGWIAGHKKWHDHPVCAHGRIADVVIDANDTQESEDGETKKEQARRATLVKLGYEGVLDTWWIPELVVEYLLDKKRESAQQYAVAVLKATAKWKKERYQVMLIPKNSVLRHVHKILSESYKELGRVWVKVS